MTQSGTVICKNAHLIFFFLAILLLTSSCEEELLFSFYQANVPDKYCYTTEENLRKISQFNPTGSTVKVAVIADTHYSYDELHDALDHINKRNDILFVIVAGDITDQGLLQEYLLFYETMKQLTKPYLTVIGNHEYLSNGEKIYLKMYGAGNYSFVLNKVKFILFNDVFWESEKKPDFNWLVLALENHVSVESIIVISHIPPSDPQFPDEYRKRYCRLMQTHAVSMSVHGHLHAYYLRELYSDGIMYLGVPAIKERAYCELTIHHKTITAKKVNY